MKEVIDQFTTGERTGTGLFEELMRSITSQMDAQYASKRITGDSYGRMFTEVMVQGMSVAAQFVMTESMNEVQKRLIEEQILKAKQDVLIAEEQLVNLKADTDLKKKQILLMDAQISQTNAQTSLTSKQEDKLDKDILLTDAQINIATEQLNKAQADTSVAHQQKINMEAEERLLGQNLLKATEETKLLTQKTLTEVAQTSDTVNGSPVGGVVQRQNAQSEAQAEGLVHDALLKLGNMYVETWLTRQNTDGATADTAGLQDSEILKVLTKIQTTLNV